MRARGRTYWGWADAHFHCHTHTETLDTGTTIDVQVRLSLAGADQMFIGLYGEDGEVIHEESYKIRPGQSMTTALNWGEVRARDIAQSKAI